MKTAKTLLLLALSASLAACAADAPDGGGGGGGNGGGNGGGEEEEPISRDDATGKYQMRSNFDLATNAPGQVGEVTRAIIAATNDADDPSNWLLEQMINQISNSTLKSLLNGARPFVAGYLNDRLLQYAPDFVSTMVQLGNDFGQIATNFGTNETLDVTGGSNNQIDATTAFSYTSTHTIVGAHFTVDGMESDHAFADYNMQNIAVQNVGVTLASDGKFGLAQHMVPLSYGQILRIGVDAVLIPMVDPTAQNLGQLMQNLVDCQAVGSYAASAIGFSSFSGALATACNAGLVVAANEIYEKIEAIGGSALELGLTGNARALDTNNDDKIDKIQTGTWTGDATYAGEAAPLAGATFYGSRMGTLTP